MTPQAEAEATAFKIILSNVVARLAVILADGDSQRQRELLGEMKDACKLAAEHGSGLGRSSDERRRITDETLTQIEAFFKGITIRS